MLGFLILGLLSYLVNIQRLILSFFGCAALLCIFLKSASNNNLQSPRENENFKFTIAHINVTSAEESYENFLENLKNYSMDILSFQEVTPDWAQILNDALKEDYPYFVNNVRIDPFGMAIYSKFPVVETDTLMFENTPFLRAKIGMKPNREINIYNILLMPSIDSRLDILQDNQLKFLTSYLDNSKGTELVLGDFNMVYWSSRIRDFRNKAHLLNSRRDISTSVLSIPYDHIFHSADLECTKFQDLIDSEGHRMGISANLQFRKPK